MDFARLAPGFMLPGLRASLVHAVPGDPAARSGPDHVAVRGMRDWTNGTGPDKLGQHRDTTSEGTK